MNEERLGDMMTGSDTWGSAMNSQWSWLVTIIVLVSSWFIFQKAGRPGWAAIIPIYNVLVLLEIVGKPWWWLLLLLVPLVNIVIGILLTHELSKAFGKSGWYTVGLVFLPFIFYPLLAFGDAKYRG